MEISIQILKISLQYLQKDVHGECEHEGEERDERCDCGIGDGRRRRLD